MTAGAPPAISRAGLDALVGRPLGTSDWLTIDQARVDGFAAVTDDHQYVHVDPVRAAATPFGGTIAHGLRTLSLIVPLCIEFVPVIEGRTLLVNYGFDKVRFPAPVRVGRRVRASAELAAVEERKPGQLMMTLDVMIALENVARHQRCRHHP